MKSISSKSIFDTLYFAPILLSYPLRSHANFAPPEFIYVNSLPFPELFLIVYKASWFFAFYFFVLLFVAFVRKIRHKPYRLLFKYSLFGFFISSMLISWQSILPCKYTPIGCKISNGIEVPQVPTNLMN